ncbi:MAG: o-succinylbenzoate synthase [Coraliomargarita sp.]
MSTRQIFFRPYRRAFREALRTSRGEWRVREGFIVRVEQAGRVSYGEVAPMPEFGSETVEAARAFLESLEADPLRTVPEDLPCCAFALSCALRGADGEPRDYAVAGLLPAGQGALAVAVEKAALGYGTLKWKVGVEAPEIEQAVLAEMFNHLPEGVRLRLDANGVWTEAVLVGWLDFLQAFRERIEFIEQPLPVGMESRMAACSVGSGIALALDESLNGPEAAKWLEEWVGPLVIKPLLMGDCESLLDRLQPVAPCVVLSSVFETGVGLYNALQLADALPGMNHAIGFDTLNFSDDLAGRGSSALLSEHERAHIDLEVLWRQLPQSI